jgi:hypothetical protein
MAAWDITTDGKPVFAGLLDHADQPDRVTARPDPEAPRPHRNPDATAISGEIVCTYQCIAC